MLRLNRPLYEVREILEVESIGFIISPVWKGVVAYLVFLMVSFQLTVASIALPEQPFPTLFVVVLDLVAAAVWVGLILLEYRLIEGFRARIIAAIPTSGVIERLALGWDHVTGIYDHTPFPWTLFLGHKPRKLNDAVRVLLANISWYLTEPRRYINPLWILIVCESALFILFFAVQIYIVRTAFTGGRTPLEFFLIIPVCMALLIPVNWVSLHYKLRRKIAAGILLEELRKLMK